MPELHKATATLKEGFLCGNPAAAPFTDLDDFYRRGQLVHLEEFFVYESPELITKILVPIAAPGYARATAEDAADALLRLPDPDFITRLFLVDHVHPMTPWLQQSQGQVVMGESSGDGMALMYRPTAASIQLSLGYEWCNLLRLYHAEAEDLFRLTQAFEDFVDLETGAKIKHPSDAWNMLGCLLLNAPEELAFAICVRFPLKSAVFARTLLKSLLDIADFRQSAHHENYLAKAKMLDYAGSKLSLDALSKGPRQDRAITTLMKFLAQQDLLHSRS
jgi:hypothetical protein